MRSPREFAQKACYEPSPYRTLPGGFGGFQTARCTVSACEMPSKRLRLTPSCTLQYKVLHEGVHEFVCESRKAFGSGGLGVAARFARFRAGSSRSAASRAAPRTRTCSRELGDLRV